MPQYAATWPVLDIDLTQRELETEARPLLTEMLLTAGLDPIGEPAWSLHERPTGAVFLHARLDVVATGRRAGA